ncbi:MAG: hypothetical protein JWM10_1234 [Myxococcaceae bacterium]|nr:hypothetical protein [Myxococcaceae bacterium]
MRFTCDHCQRGFESTGARCPTCFRRSTVRPAGAPLSAVFDEARPPPRRGVALALMSALMALCALMLWAAVAAERRDAAMAARGLRVTATVTRVRAQVASRTGGCDVEYRYDAGGHELTGHDRVSVGCPAQLFGTVTVEFLPESPERSRLAEGHGGDRLFMQCGAVLVALFWAAMLPVWGHLAFPRSAVLRRLAARIGSRHARAEG